MVITASPTSGIKCQVGDFSLLVDSPSQKKGNLILKTLTEMSVDSFSSENIVYGPGEYEISGVRVRGVTLPGESNSKSIKSIYTAQLDDIHLAFFLNISTPPPEDTLDKLGEVDILFISTDTGKLKPKQTISLIKQIDPSIVIPVTDKTAKILNEEMGQKAKAQEKLVIKKSNLIKEDIANKLVWLKTK